MIVALLVGIACLLIIIVILSFVIRELDRDNMDLRIRDKTPKRITNYERITGMTVEQMARWMAERVTIIECVHSEVHMIKGGAGLDPEVMNALADQMYEAHLEWLMQPVGEDPDVE